MKNRKTTSDYFKQVGVDINTYKVNPNKKVSKRNTPGLKKGSGGVDNAALAAGASGSGGVAERLDLLAQISEAIEDITDTDEANELEQEGDGTDVDGEFGGDEGFGEDGGEAVKRFVPGAHLVFKRQSETDSYEELWIYQINPSSPLDSAKIERQILAGTDIDPGTLSSEEGTQVATTWVAGNAKYMHITGLSN